MVSVERTFQVDARFVRPDLDGVVPKGGRVVARPPVTLRATYFDTADLRLARAGVSLRYRSGDDNLPWTVRLPAALSTSATVGTRHEISSPAAPGGGRRSAIPPELLALVTVFARGAPLEPAVTIRTTRLRFDLRDRHDVRLAEVADDTVAVLDDRRVLGRFREIEVELKDGRPKVLRRVGDALIALGAVEGECTPKHVRAMAVMPALVSFAAGPPDLPPPAELPKKASTADAITAVLRTDIGRVLQHDPHVRLHLRRTDASSPVAIDAVHEMRLGVRRVRSTLRQFAPLYAGEWATQLADELHWLGDVLGRIRDVEVLQARLRTVAGSDPACPLDGASVARIDAELAARHEDARTGVDEALASPRYAALVDRLVAVAAGGHFRPIAGGRASRLLPRFVARAWHRLVFGRHGIDGANELDARMPDDQWHAVRIEAKRARYAVEAAIGAIGAPARSFADALADVTDILGAHRDAVVAAEAWLSIAGSDPDDHLLAITAGRLIERERAAARTAGDAYPVGWRAAMAPNLTAWLDEDHPIRGRRGLAR